MDAAVAVAAFGALGTIVSAYLVYRVQIVQRTVDGTTERLEQRVDELQRELVRASLRIVPPAPDTHDEA